MLELSQEQLTAVEAAGWTEDDHRGFAQALADFRDGLPPRQRDAFTAILATAAQGDASADDVQGYLVVLAIIQPLIGILLPAVQRVRQAPRQ